jgi:hypothetical protein
MALVGLHCVFDHRYEVVQGHSLLGLGPYFVFQVVIQTLSRHTCLGYSPQVNNRPWAYAVDGKPELFYLTFHAGE